MNLFESIYEHPLLNQNELELIKRSHTRITFKKGEYLLKKGNIANAYYLIESGLLRSYVYDYNQEAITTSFTTPNEILIEVSSLFQRIPSEENKIALISGSAWKMDFQVFQELFHNIEGLREWGRAWMANQLFEAKHRSIDMYTKSATERYRILLEKRPFIIQNAPLKHIASYLGITDTSLSRIRKDFFNT